MRSLFYRSRTPADIVFLLRHPLTVTGVAILATMLGISALGTTGTEAARVHLERAYVARRPFLARLPSAGYAPLDTRTLRASSFDKPRPLQDAELQLAAYPDLALRGRADLLNLNIDAALTALQTATDAHPRDPAIVADLAAAYAVRAEKADRPLDWARSIEQSSRVLELDPGNLPALHNRALALGRLRMHSESRRDWEELLRREPDAGWRREAEEQLSPIRKVLDRTQRKGNATPELRLNTRLLGGWKGEDPEKLAAELRARHADSWLTDVLREGQRGMAQVAAAYAANQRGDAAALDHAHQAIQASPGADSAVALRAQAEQVYALHRARRGRACRLLAADLAARAKARGYVWIEWHARLEHAICAAVEGNYEQGFEEMRTGLGGVRATGYSDLALRWAGIHIADRVGTANEPGDGVWRDASGALETYWAAAEGSFPANRVQQLFYAMDRAALSAGLPQTALLFRRAAVDILEDSGQERLVQLNRLSLAEDAARSGQFAMAREQFRIAEARLKTPVADEVTAIEVARGAIALESGEPVRRVWDHARRARVQPATPFMRARWHGLRGELQARLGEWNGARQDLGQARSALSGNRLESERARLWWIESQIQESADAAKAFWAWEGSAPRDATEMLRGRRFLAWALLPRGVYAWVHDGKQVHGIRLAVTAEQARRHALQAARLCANPESAMADIAREQAWLQRHLVRPLAARIPEGMELLVEADGDLRLAPLRLLFGRQARVAQVENLPDALRRARPLRVSRESKALIVAEPDLGALPLAPLPQARAEGQLLRERFPNGWILRGAEATVANIVRFAPEADLFHFGGHGVVVGSQGYLMVAPGQRWGGEALGQAGWSRCQLAVLAACSTASGEREGSANPATVARILLQGGASRVVAARWALNSADAATVTHVFYDRLQGGVTAADALAAALREALPADAHPYRWAAFELFGQL